jgi:hypothetical protein
VKSQVPLPEQTLVPLTGAGAQGRQSADPKQPVWSVLPAQIPPQRCWPAGQPMPDPVLAAVVAPLVPAALLVTPEVVVAPLLVLPLVVAPVVPPALVDAGSPPPPLVVAPGPSATPPPTPPPPKPPSPSLVALVSAALAQP